MMANIYSKFISDISSYLKVIGVIHNDIDFDGEYIFQFQVYSEKMRQYLKSYGYCNANAFLIHYMFNCNIFKCCWKKYISYLPTDGLLCYRGYSVYSCTVEIRIFKINWTTITLWIKDSITIPFNFKIVINCSYNKS